MAGVGRGALRPNTGGKQSFAIIALIVAIAVLGVNYWSVTSKNRRLVTEFEKLRKSYKLCTESIEQVKKDQQDAVKTAGDKDKVIEDTRRVLADEKLDVDKLRRELTVCQRNISATANDGATLLGECKSSCAKRQKEIEIDKQLECDSRVLQATEEQRNKHVQTVEKIVHDAQRNCNVLLQSEVTKAQKEYQLLQQQLVKQNVDRQQQKVERQEPRRVSGEQIGDRLSQDVQQTDGNPGRQVEQPTQQRQQQQQQQGTQLRNSQLQLVSNSKQPEKSLQNEPFDNSAQAVLPNVPVQQQQQQQQPPMADHVEEHPKNQLSLNPVAPDVQQLSEQTNQQQQQQQQEQQQPPSSLREKRQSEIGQQVEKNHAEVQVMPHRPVEAQSLTRPETMGESLFEQPGRRILAPSAALSLIEQSSQDATASSAGNTSHKTDGKVSSLNAPSDRQRLPVRDVETLKSPPAANRGNVPVGSLKLIRPGVPMYHTYGLDNGRVGRHSVIGPEGSLNKNHPGGNSNFNLNAGEKRIERFSKLSNDGIAKVEVPPQLPGNDQQPVEETDRDGEIAADNDDKEDGGDEENDGADDDGDGDVDDGKDQQPDRNKQVATGNENDELDNDNENDNQPVGR